MHVPAKLLPLIALAALMIGSAMDADAASRRRRTADTSPAAGDQAPDFELVTVKWLMMDDAARARAESEAKSKAAAVPVNAAQQREKPAVRPGHVRLSSFHGKKPVLFVLTSYT